MTLEIVVTPADPALRGLPFEDLPGSVREDLRSLREEMDRRFPEGERVGHTGALCERPELVGASVVLRPEVITRPLVVNAVMRAAAPRALAVACPQLALHADPRERVTLDVHRRPTTARTPLTDDTVRGRPHGTLPWITRPLLERLVALLEVVGDCLELEVDPERRFRYERTGCGLVLTVTDGPRVPARTMVTSTDEASLREAARIGWDWARCDACWQQAPGWGSALAA